MDNIPCTNLSNARPGMSIYHRFDVHGNMVLTSILDVIFDHEKYKLGIKGIILRVPTKMNNEGHYDVSFLPDGRQNGGGVSLCAQTIYPMTDKYRAIYEFELNWQLNEKARMQMKVL